MEVLEEEEIRKMREHQREFEMLRNRELEEVQTLEKKEQRINEEKVIAYVIIRIYRKGELKNKNRRRSMLSYIKRDFSVARSPKNI